MRQYDFSNPKQKEILAQFYSNTAFTILTFGAIAPLFTGIGNINAFIVRFILTISFTIIFLNFSLRFLK